jgi:hypothetical protein
MPPSAEGAAAAGVAGASPPDAATSPPHLPPPPPPPLPPLPPCAAAAALASRLLPAHAHLIDFELAPPDPASPHGYFSAAPTPCGRLRVAATSALELAAGLHWWLKHAANCSVSWDTTGGPQVDAAALDPARLRAAASHCAAAVRVARAVPLTWHQNVVTMSYSFAFWDWPRCARGRPGRRRGRAGHGVGGRMAAGHKSCSSCHEQRRAWPDTSPLLPPCPPPAPQLGARAGLDGAAGRQHRAHAARRRGRVGARAARRLRAAARRADGLPAGARVSRMGPHGQYPGVGARGAPADKGMAHAWPQLSARHGGPRCLGLRPRA